MQGPVGRHPVKSWLGWGHFALFHVTSLRTSHGIYSFFSKIQRHKKARRNNTLLRPRLKTVTLPLPSHAYGQGKSHSQIKGSEMCSPHAMRGHVSYKSKGVDTVRGKKIKVKNATLTHIYVLY